ncbi:hypothetical protein Gorai_002553, partial [Gossypium raimondii]|nr:hypothetical protein [Gossypium raimondii]
MNDIILAQEVIHSTRSKHNSKRLMAIKIDLEKPYDRVRWDFIKSSIQMIGILEFFMKVIMSAITNTSMQILWNRVLTQKFNPELIKIMGGVYVRLSNSERSKILDPISSYFSLVGSPHNSQLFYADHDDSTSIPPPHPSVGVDIVSWMGTLTGSFSIKSAYKTIKENLWNLKDETWKISWKGILRDNHGEWIIGFCRQLGKCLILDAELWGILDGLSLVQES